MTAFQIPKYVERGLQKHEELITKSGKRLFLPVLPQTPNSPDDTVTFKHKKFVKSNTRIIYKNRAVSILDNAVKLHGNIDNMINKKFKSSDLSRFSERFKRRYFSRCLANDVLLRRDRWVQCIYFTLHKLNVYSTEQFAKIQLSTDEDCLEAILGTACHAKGWTPYFPEFCFTNGTTEYPFKKGGKHKPKVVNPCLEGHAIYPCLSSCIPASKEQALKVLDILEKCQKLDRKQLRQFLMTLDKCDESIRTFYKKTTEKRNHPIDCYSGENLCSSDLVLLRKLYPHYASVRKLYQILNDLKNMHEMLYDLDAAVACGDFEYLTKLLAYLPPEKPSKVHSVERPDSIVNRKNLVEKYGNHVLDFDKHTENLPRTACICCEKLIDDAHIQTITARRKNLSNTAWQQLLAYLNSNARTVTRGEPRVDSLIGQTICSSCSSELNKNKIPTISIINGMDTGPQPDCIKALSEFESIFIHLAMCYQTIIKLTPMGANLPYNSRMDKLKGFAVHITQPLDSAITELFGNRPTKLVNPDEYIVLHGIPKKNRAVWQRLVSVEKVHAALMWLKKNNPLYQKIDIPENPIDLLPPDVPPHDDNGTKSDAGKPDSDSDSSNCNADCDVISNPSSGSLPMFDFDNDMPQGPGMAPASHAQSGDSVSSITGRYHISTGYEIDPHDLHNATDGEQIDHTDKQRVKKHDRQRHLSGGCHKTEENKNDDIFQADSRHHIDTVVLRQEEIEKLNTMVTQIEKLKFVIIKKLLGYSRQLSVLGQMCDICDKDLRKIRTYITRRLGSQHTLVNHNSFDIANMSELVGKYKIAIEASKSTLHKNMCTLCHSLRKPNSEKRINSKRCKKFQKMAINCDNYKHEINEIQENQINYLTKIDELRTDGYLCKPCHVKYDQCCEVSDLKCKSKTKLMKILRKSKLKMDNCDCEVATSMIARHKKPRHDLIVVLHLKSCGAAEKSLRRCLRRAIIEVATPR